MMKKYYCLLQAYKRTNSNTSLSWCSIVRARAQHLRRISVAADSTHPAAEENSETAPLSGEARVSELGIPLLSPRLHAQVFGPTSAKEDNLEQDKHTERVKIAAEHLAEHGLWRRGQPELNTIEPQLQIPPLTGDSLETHFYLEAERQCSAYRTLLHKLVAAEQPPPTPNKWLMTPGWTRYSSDGSHQSVPYPDCDALVFDVEVVVRRQLVAMATAVSAEAWYGWVSPHVVEDSVPASPRISADQLVPLDGYDSSARIVVGHNVSYDRQFVREQYALHPTGTRFMDTMSMHIAVGGVTSQQRALRLSMKSAKAKGKPTRTYADLEWMSETSGNSLADVYQLYCDGTLQKDVRQVFVKGDIADVHADFQHLMQYCAGDSAATWRVLRALLPEFLERFPHPATLAGTLHMGQVYLPVGPGWAQYLCNCRDSYADLENELSTALKRVADAACRAADGEAYRNDPWLWDLDWSTQDLKIKKTPVKKKKATESPPPLPSNWRQLPCRMLSEKELESDSPLPDPLNERFRVLWETRSLLYKKQPVLPGYPRWYRDLCGKNGEGLSEMTTAKRCVPKLLRLTWRGYPLHYDAKRGWGYLVPQDQAVKKSKRSTRRKIKDEEEDFDEGFEESRSGDFITIGEHDESSGPVFPVEALRSLTSGLPPPDGTPSLDVLVPGCHFYPLPHPDGPGNNVGNPLSKHFLTEALDGGALRAVGGGSAEHVLRISQSVSYWRNNQDRIGEQLAVFGASAAKDPQDNAVDHESTSSSMDQQTETGGRWGAILPQVRVAGTLTRRAVERTWLTASSPRGDRLGSELRAAVQAPPGRHLVGADVDAQELWIAAVLADAAAAARMPGCTAFSWMALQGSKADGTDLHSRTAQLMGVSRDLAKVLNYGRIYGGAKPFACQLVRRHAPGLSGEEVEQKVSAMYRQTKGVRKWSLNASGRNALRQLQLAEAETEDGGRSSALLALFGAGADGEWTLRELSLLARLSGAARDGRHFAARPRWHGGTESAMFNRLEAIASTLAPETPVLKARLSRGLEPQLIGDQFATSRVNWVVQSSAVDFLHLMLVCQQWLMDRCRIDGRFCISIHDEVRYLVRSEDRYRAALTLQMTNLLVRAFFCRQLGLQDLPHSVAFFSAVDIDQSLRKDVLDDCVTPSNPHGLEASYGIGPGEALDIHQIVQRTGPSPLPS